MSEESADRRAELIAAALAGELTAGEAEELAQMRAADPSIEVEIEEMSALTGTLASVVPTWQEEEPSSRLRERVIGTPTAEADGEEAFAPSGVDAEVVPLPSEADVGVGRIRRRVRTVLGAAACVAAGVALAAGGYTIATAPPSGPPGTLGAVEEVEFAVEPAGVRVEGALIAHTWGTETVMEIDGLTPGESYVLVLVATDGTEFDSGTFFGSEVTIDCRMNAAVMRHDVSRVEIRDDAGEVVSGSDLPEAVEG